MEGFNSNPQENLNQTVAADLSVSPTGSGNSTTASQGSSVLDSNFQEALDQSVLAPASSTPVDDHDHGAIGTGGNPAFHISLDAVDIKSIDLTNAQGRPGAAKLARISASNGDFLDPGAGKNTVIGSGASDIFVGKGGGFNTITTGKGRDTIVLGEETTNRIFDFNPNKDTIAIDSSISLDDIVIAQGKNPGKGGLNQPLDSVNNVLIIDKRGEGHILASFTFAKADLLTDKNFVQIQSSLLDQISSTGNFANTLQADDSGTQLNGTIGRDKLIGGAGDDFLHIGDDGFQFRTARGTGPDEFPFPNTSPGTTKLNAELQDGVLRVNGAYKNFEGAPLFSQGETAIDPTATILNGSDPQALIAGFLKVPNDVEGNPISGTHLHFSPSLDSRGNFADATVLRYFTNTPTDAKSGTITGEFELSPEEQAALLAGNLYVNIHTNVDVDGDGLGGLPTGENRMNFNQNGIRFAQGNRQAAVPV
jgi:hypothetical protein